MRVRSHLAILLAIQFTAANVHATLGGDQAVDPGGISGIATPVENQAANARGEQDYGYILMSELQVQKLDLTDLSEDVEEDEGEDATNDLQESIAAGYQPDNLLQDNVDLSAIESNSAVIMSPGRFWIRDGILDPEDGQRYVRVELESGYQFWTKLSEFDNAVYVAEGQYAGKASGKVTSKAGWRVHPVSGRMKCHEGTDIAYPTGTPVGARAGAGTVTKAGRSGGYGNLVELSHSNGMISRYAHLSKISVKVGQKVKAGQTLGKVGCTGTCTGPHLHYEYKKKGTSLCKGKGKGKVKGKGKKSKKRKGKRK